jgi:site-specific recombinase XerD
MRMLLRPTPRRATLVGKVTDHNIASVPIPTKGRAVVLRDGKIPGFVCRIGQRVRAFELRIEGQRGAHIRIGDTVTMNAAQARQKALDYLGRHRKGEPLQLDYTASAAKQWPSIPRVLALWEDDIDNRSKSPHTRLAYRNAVKRLSDYVLDFPFGLLATNPQVMREEWELLQEWPAAAMQSMRVVRTLYKYARKRVARTLPDLDPCSDIKITSVEPNADRPVMTEAQMAAWWRQVQRLPNATHREAHTFAILSGLRRAEFTGLEWKNLDVAARKFKTKIKGGRIFELPLSRAMLRCLWRARKAGRGLPAGEQFVFPATRGDGHIFDLCADKLMSPHALRRSYASHGFTAVKSIEMIDGLLGHQISVRPVMRAYIRDEALFDERLRAQEIVSKHLIALLVPNPAERRGLM